MTNPNSLKTSLKDVNSENSIEAPRVNKAFPVDVVPFFSVRKLRVVYSELQGTQGFSFSSFEAFKQEVLSSIAPQLELSKWESLAARR